MTLEKLTSDLLTDVRHGFYTRLGGASSGIFEGLNCGAGSSDQSEIVEINRARVQHDMGPDMPLIGIHQIHSSTVVIADPSQLEKPKADGIVTNSPGIILTVLTADCQPILFHDPENGVIGAAHAGWRGALDGIIENTIAKMETLGAKRDQIYAAIGPCISQPAYEVGQDFFENFLDIDPEYSRFFTNGTTPDKYQFDLPGFGLFKLRESGVKSAEWIRHCTYSDARRFYSYRRSVHQKQADYGRLISCIRL